MDTSPNPLTRRSDLFTTPPFFHLGRDRTLCSTALGKLSCFNFAKLCKFCSIDSKRGISILGIPLFEYMALHRHCFVYSKACDHWAAFSDFFCFTHVGCSNYCVAS